MGWFSRCWTSENKGIFERQEANDCDVAIHDCHGLLPFASVQMFSPSAMLKIYIYMIDMRKVCKRIILLCGVGKAFLTWHGKQKQEKII